jgi:DNA-binding XRE family transcriptional regulator
MARDHKDILNSLAPAQRDAVAARAGELRREIDGLKALRRLAARTQEQLAETLGIKQPSVHKIERQSDLYLSTLRRFIEAAGGQLELVVTFPDMEPMRLTGLGQLTDKELG